MYNETYEEYIRSILGYPNYDNPNNMVEENYQFMPTNFQNNERIAQLEACYPEIYKIVYPMVNKACRNNTKPITSSLIDELTDEIYAAIETDNQINLTINLTNEVPSTENRKVPNVKEEKKEKLQANRGEDRQFRNRGLQDIIRILLIRELLGRPGRFPENRPPFPPNRPPMRPPFPPGPGGGRPPIMPRYGSDFSDLYEM